MNARAVIGPALVVEVTDADLGHAVAFGGHLLAEPIRRAAGAAFAYVGHRATHALVYHQLPSGVRVCTMYDLGVDAAQLCAAWSAFGASAQYSLPGVVMMVPIEARDYVGSWPVEVKP